MRTPYQIRDDVRRLRREQTPAEGLLWQNLRAKRLKGAKFRRQHPIGNQIVDFCCLAHRLIIEVDDGQHAEEAEKDAARTKRLVAHGFKVIRFSNHEVLRNLEGVLTNIAEALRTPRFEESDEADTERADAESQR